MPASPRRSCRGHAACPPWRPPSPSRLDSVNRGLPVGPSNPRPPLESRLQQRIKEDCADVAAIIGSSLGDAPRSRQLERITVPVLVIHGSNPEQMSGDGGPGLAAILPNAKLVTVADAGHDPWLDRREGGLRMGLREPPRRI